jgi:hypothetical protein
MKSDRIAELLYEALKQEYTMYVDDILKTVGFLVVVLGWLLTSETARKALQVRVTNTLATICTVFVAGNIVLLLVGHYLRSRQLEDGLTRIAPEMHDLIVNYAIQPGHLLINALALGPLVALLLAVIWRLRA